MSRSKFREGAGPHIGTLCQSTKPKENGPRTLHFIEAQVPIDESSLKQRAVGNTPDRVDIVLSSFQFANPVVSTFHSRYLRAIVGKLVPRASIVSHAGNMT